MKLALLALACACSAGADRVVHHRAPVARVRVVLYGAPEFTKGGDPTRMRFTPLACAIDGALATGPACGEAMPETATVQVVGGAQLAVERLRSDYHDEAGEQMFRAPRGPECCNYHSCRGETVPFLAAPGTAPDEPPRDERGLVDHGGNHVVALWPPDADIGLVRHAPTIGAGAEGPADVVVDQLVRVRGAALASGRPVGSERCRSCAELFSERGGAWQRVAGREGDDGFVVMVTTDLDVDGRPEAILRQVARNNYGVIVFGNDWDKPRHEFSCGNL